jgi:hypothetical protein
MPRYSRFGSRGSSYGGSNGPMGTSSSLQKVVSLQGLHIDQKSMAMPKVEAKPTRCHVCGNVPKHLALLLPTGDGRWQCKNEKACAKRGPDPMIGWNPE